MNEPNHSSSPAANWNKIIEQCNNNRPAGTTAKQWISDNGINDKSYYHRLRELRREAYASAEKKFPAVTPSQEQRPVVTFAEIPLPNQQNSMTDTFKADTVIHTRTMVIGISNTISDTLLSRLLEATHHAH